MADPPKEVVDALSTVIGAAKARALRVGIQGLASLAAVKGFGFINPADQTTTFLVTVAITAALSGLGKWVRDNGWLPSWVPL